MKKKAWLPILTLTTGIIPQLASASTYVPDVRVKCNSEEPEMTFTFIKPYRSSFSHEYRMRLEYDTADKSKFPKFDDLGASDYGDDLYISPKAFKVRLFYYFTPGEGPIINEDIGILEGTAGADGKWNVTFTQTNTKAKYKKAEVGQEIALDCQEQK